MTALSYSWTTLKQMKIEIGNVNTMMTTEAMVASTSMHPAESASAESIEKVVFLLQNLELCLENIKLISRLILVFCN
jgi:hypothetical protein